MYNLWIKPFWLNHTIYHQTNLANSGTDSGLSPPRYQAITWTNAELLIIWLIGTNLNELFLFCQENALQNGRYHCSDVIMSMIMSQMTGIRIVYSTTCSDTEHRKHQSSAGLCEGNSPVTSEFPAKRASNVENVSAWWRHHVLFRSQCVNPCHDTKISPTILNNVYW